MKKDDSDQLLLRILSKKIGAIDLDLVIGDAVVGDKHMLKFAGKRVEDGEAMALKREAEIIEGTKLFKAFTETLRYQAHEAMFTKSQKSEDVYISGKFLLHAISTFEHIIWACKNPLLLADQQKQLSPTRGGRRVAKEEKRVNN